MGTRTPTRFGSGWIFRSSRTAGGQCPSPDLWLNRSFSYPTSFFSTLWELRLHCFSSSSGFRSSSPAGIPSGGTRWSAAICGGPRDSRHISLD